MDEIDHEAISKRQAHKIRSESFALESENDDCTTAEKNVLMKSAPFHKFVSLASFICRLTTVCFAVHICLGTESFLLIAHSIFPFIAFLPSHTERFSLEDHVGGKQLHWQDSRFTCVNVDSKYSPSPKHLQFYQIMDLVWTTFQSRECQTASNIQSWTCKCPSKILSNEY